MTKREYEDTGAYSRLDRRAFEARQQGLTYEAIAIRMGVSRERARQRSEKIRLWMQEAGLL